MAEDVETTGDPAIEALRWRDEILGVLFWLRGEGIMEEATIDALGGFLDASPELLREHLERLTAESYLMRNRDGEETAYRLSEFGDDEGKRIFADNFAELTGAAHGECGPGCSCQRHGADACRIAAA